VRATRKAILTNARNRLVGNGYAQGMGQIPDARNLHPSLGLGMPLRATPLTIDFNFGLIDKKKKK